jgi:hypothetical protein
MPGELVVETGAGVSGANTYVSQAYADTYLANHASAATWAALTADQKNLALQEATRYIEARFSQHFVGTKKSYSDPLSWPRLAIYDQLGRLEYADGTVPKRIKDAECEYALQAAVSTLFTNPSTQTAVEVSSKIGPLEKKTKYASSVAPSGTPLVNGTALRQMTAADLLISPLVQLGTLRRLSKV